MKSSLFWEGPIVPILYVLQTCASENTELIAEVVTVTEKAEGFVALRAQKPPPGSESLGDSLVLPECTGACQCLGTGSAASCQAKLKFSLSRCWNNFWKHQSLSWKHLIFDAS